MRQDSQDRSGAQLAGKVLAVIAVLAACALAVAVAVFIVIPEVAHNGSASLKNAIIQSANQCYAIEGSYPYNLEYLENNYGLVINHDDYAITYEVFADNVAPSVVVVEK